MILYKRATKTKILHASLLSDIILATRPWWITATKLKKESTQLEAEKTTLYVTTENYRTSTDMHQHYGEIYALMCRGAGGT